MPRPDDHETESNAGCIVWIIAIGVVVVIGLLVIGFFVVDAIIGRQ